MRNPPMMGHFKTLTQCLDESLSVASMFVTIVDKKIAIDSAYALKVDSLFHDQHSSFLAEFINKLQTVNTALHNSLTTFSQSKKSLDGQTKKLLLCGQDIQKGILAEKERVIRIKNKFQKKNKQLQSKKIQYIGVLLAGESLEVRNKLYLKVMSLQKQIAPLRVDYQYHCEKYNENVQKNSEVFKSIIINLAQQEKNRNERIQKTMKLYYEQQLSVALQMASNICLYQIPSYVSYDERAFVLSKEQLLIPFQISSAYIDALFGKIENKSIENVILHGSQEYKVQLNGYFDTNIPPSTMCQDSLQLATLFREYFEYIPPEDESRLGRLLRKGPLLRKEFIFCLQQYRISKVFELRKANYASIVRALNLYLDECLRSNDTYNAKHLMVLSVTYYFTLENVRVDLQEIICTHRIWANLSWWEAALLESVYEEVKIKHVKKAEPLFTEWQLKGQIYAYDGEEGTYQHIAFNQIAYYIHNMPLFQLHQPSIHQFAAKYIRILGFSPEMHDKITQMCPKRNQSTINVTVSEH